MTTRDLDNLPRRFGNGGLWNMIPKGWQPHAAWTGDVWKLIPILQTWRPDLRLTVLDCALTALVCIRNLSPGNTVLRDKYVEICAEWDGVALETYGLDRFQQSFELSGAEDCARRGFQLFQPASIDPALALRPAVHST
ncbi:hypothetical protein [Tabrizicola sp.]|uniref:hypothetical protein n=1 Tax=Tabrizicola sp. TaxID=2005166 RepID=UPI00286CFBF3|nr:hypothetical protein [Tabrizicola sp.]